MAGKSPLPEPATICSIDIGSMYSGYAFYHKPTGLMTDDESAKLFKESVDDVSLNALWGGFLGLTSYKTFTSLLTNPEGCFEEFGYEAQYKYGQLYARKDLAGRQLYPYFKLQIINEKVVNESTMLTSYSGNKIAASVIFKMTLNFMKAHAIKMLKTNDSSLNADNIQWVITLPHQWLETSRTFFLNLAKQAGMIGSHEVVLLPESQAAATYCRLLDINQMMGINDKKLTENVTLNLGSRFIVIDFGGTVKVTSYQINADGMLKNVDQPVRFDYGGQTIDNTFHEVLGRIFKVETIKTYQTKCLDFWFDDFVILFEREKRKLNTASAVNIHLKDRFIKEADVSRDGIEALTARFQELGITSNTEGDIVFNKDALDHLYEQFFNSIVPRIHQVLKSQQLTDMKYIFLVGGLVHSKIFKMRMEKEFGLKHTVVVPSDAYLATLKGGVLATLLPGDKVQNLVTKRKEDIEEEEAVEVCNRDDQPEKPKYKYVCAIDFGTTYSGYAYSQDGGDVIMNKMAEEDSTSSGFKTPTAVLTDETGELIEFGSEAESKYIQLCEKNRAQGLNLYKHFKMLLHNEKDLTRKTVVTSTTGTQRPAFDIFVLCLKFFLKKFAEEVKDRTGRQPGLDEVRWIITIPAIWSDKAKQFMREAANKAGLTDIVNSRQLLFALEPEAAAIYLKNLQMDKFKGTDESRKKRASFNPGSKYMVVDAGGGTVDISIQEVLEEGNLKILDVPSGGNWGSNSININFENMMANVFHGDFIQDYKKKYPEDWLELHSKFEKEKRKIKPDGESEISLQVYQSLKDHHKDFTKQTLEQALEKSGDCGLSIRKYRLYIEWNTVFNLYHRVMGSIIPHMENLLESPRYEGCNQIFLVGGFSDSMFFRKAVDDAFYKHVVLTPENSSSAVLRGAVEYGRDEKRIQSRIAKKTYGCSMLVRFDEEKHDPQKRVLDENKVAYCRDSFEIYVKEGEEVEFGQCKTFLSYPFVANAQQVTKTMYTTNKEGIKYADEQGVEKVGELVIPMLNTEGGRDREIETKIYFGGSEIIIESYDKREGSEIRQICIDFLCETNN